MKFNKITFAFIIVFSSLLFGQQVEKLIDEGDKLNESFNNNGALEKYLQADKAFPKELGYSLANKQIICKYRHSYA